VPKETSRMPAASAPLTILLTGFGPFPGARFNPTGALVEHLARMQRPALAGTKRIARVFPTSYAVLDTDFPELLKKHRPDVVLMFGLASRTPHLRVETVARNIFSACLPDVTGKRPARTQLARGKATALRNPAPTMRVLQAARTARVPAAMSRDAGRYLCNALYWCALDARAEPDGPRVAVFIHVPAVRRQAAPRARMRRRRVSATDLRRAGEAILLTVIAAARRR
jgi:pyroglutamyl-peptidase